jgi:DNA-binding response OmpR family regulator
MVAAAPELGGKRVLIVEDEMLIALLIEDFLAEMGCITVATCGSVQTALDAVGTQAFDFAILDVNLAGEMAYPVAELLGERNIPFLLLSGYGTEAVPPGHPEWKVCAKPFKGEELVKMLLAVLGPGGR